MKAERKDIEDLLLIDEIQKARRKYEYLCQNNNGSQDEIDLAFWHLRLFNFKTEELVWKAAEKNLDGIIDFLMPNSNLSSQRHNVNQKFLDARNDCFKAIAYNKFNPTAYIMGNYVSNMCDVERIQDEFIDLWNMASEDITPHFNCTDPKMLHYIDRLGNISLGQGLKFCDEALKFFPDDTSLLFKPVELLIKNEKYDRAFDVINDINESNHSFDNFNQRKYDFLFPFFLGKYYFSITKQSNEDRIVLGKATRNFENALSSIGNLGLNQDVQQIFYSEFFNSLSEIYFKMGAFDKSLEYTEKLLSLNPNNIDMQLHKCDILRKIRPIKDLENQVDDILSDDSFHNEDKLLALRKFLTESANRLYKTEEIGKRLRQLKDLTDHDALPLIYCCSLSRKYAFSKFLQNDNLSAEELAKEINKIFNPEQVYPNLKNAKLVKKLIVGTGNNRALSIQTTDSDDISYNFIKSLGSNSSRDVEIYCIQPVINGEPLIDSLVEDEHDVKQGNISKEEFIQQIRLLSHQVYKKYDNDESRQLEADVISHLSANGEINLPRINKSYSTEGVTVNVLEEVIGPTCFDFYLQLYFLFETKTTDKDLIIYKKMNDAVIKRQIDDLVLFQSSESPLQLTYRKIPTDLADKYDESLKNVDLSLLGDDVSVEPFKIFKNLIMPFIQKNPMCYFRDAAPWNCRLSYYEIIQELKKNGLDIPSQIDELSCGANSKGDFNSLSLQIPSSLTITSFLVESSLKSSEIANQISQSLYNQVYQFDFEKSNILTTDSDDLIHILESPFASSNHDTWENYFLEKKGIEKSDAYLALKFSTGIYRHARLASHYRTGRIKELDNYDRIFERHHLASMVSHLQNFVRLHSIEN